MKKNSLFVLFATILLTACDLAMPKGPSVALPSGNQEYFEYRIKQLEAANAEATEQVKLLRSNFKTQLESNTKLDKAALEEVMLNINRRLSDIKESYRTLWRFLESEATSEHLNTNKGFIVHLLTNIDDDAALQDLVNGPEALHEYIKSSFEGKSFGQGVRLSMNQLKRPIDANLPDKYDYTKVSICEAHEILKNRMLSLTMQELSFYRLLLDGIAGPVLVYDKFAVLNEPEAAQVFLGDTYRAEIMLGAFSSQADYTVQVNGRKLKNSEGLTIFEEKAKHPGRNTYQVKVSIVNPLTGELETLKREYSYWVKER